MTASPQDGAGGRGRSGRGSGTDPRRTLGRWGEDLAARHYEARGWQVLARNWRAGRLGEIDLVVARDGVIVVCEVKTRSSDAYGRATEAITAAKAQRLRRLAAAWLAETGARGQVRFDVVAITAGHLEVVEGAL